MEILCNSQKYYVYPQFLTKCLNITFEELAGQKSNCLLNKIFKNSRNHAKVGRIFGATKMFLESLISTQRTWSFMYMYILYLCIFFLMLATIFYKI